MRAPPDENGGEQLATDPSDHLEPLFLVFCSDGWNDQMSVVLKDLVAKGKRQPMLLSILSVFSGIKSVRHSRLSIRDFRSHGNAILLGTQGRAPAFPLGRSGFHLAQRQRGCS